MVLPGVSVVALPGVGAAAGRAARAVVSEVWWWLRRASAVLALPAPLGCIRRSVRLGAALDGLVAAGRAGPAGGRAGLLVPKSVRCPTPGGWGGRCGGSGSAAGCVGCGRRRWRRSAWPAAPCRPRRPARPARAHRRGTDDHPEAGPAALVGGQLVALPRLLVGQTVDDYELGRGPAPGRRRRAPLPVIPNPARTGCRIVWAFGDPLAEPFDATVPEPVAAVVPA